MTTSSSSLPSTALCTFSPVFFLISYPLFFVAFFLELSRRDSSLVGSQYDAILFSNKP